MRTISWTVSPAHTEQVFTPKDFQKLVRRVAKKVESLKKTHGVNALAACGHSGLLLTGALGFTLKLPFFAVRKKMDSAYDFRMMNGHLLKGGTKYLIIDDLISTGRTVRKIINEIDSEAVARRYKVETAAILLYRDRENRDAGFFSFKKKEVPVFYV